MLTVSLKSLATRRLIWIAVSLGAMAVFTLFGPVRLIGFGEFLPGDYVDGRLNNYFLESFYHFLTTENKSLVHLPFFYPFLWTIALSDNLWGSAPIYALFRFLGFSSDTAFQLWWISSFCINYLSAFIALRILKISYPAAILGALIFAFAIPATAHASMHAQLSYRAGIPLAFAALYRFFDTGELNWLSVAVCSVVWQFFATIYIGLFLVVGLALFTLSYVVYKRRFFIHFLIVSRQVFAKERTSLFINISIVFLSIGLLAILFWPYLYASEIYGSSRPWWMVQRGLPRLESYAVADFSTIWSRVELAAFQALPQRHEHQMFPGGLVLLLAFVGACLTFADARYRHFRPVALTLVLSIVLTLDINGYSIWRIFYTLPGFGIIRAMTRIDLLQLVFFALLGSIAVEWALQSYRYAVLYIFVPVYLVLLVEFSLVTGVSIPKETWRERVSQVELAVPDTSPDDAVLAFGPILQVPSAELDILAMWASSNLGFRTVNGYSGDVPPGARPGALTCEEIALRVSAAYQAFDFTGMGNARVLAEPIRPIGIENCSGQSLRDNVSNLSIRIEPHTPSELAGLKILGAEIVDRKLIVQISNQGDEPVIPRSLDGSHLKLSWGFVDAGAYHPGYFDTRHDFASVIEPGEIITLEIPGFGSVPPGSLWVSIVQENVFWLHDRGGPIFKQ